MFILFILRKHTPGRGRERGRERTPSRLPTVSTKPNVGLDLTKERS